MTRRAVAAVVAAPLFLLPVAAARAPRSPAGHRPAPVAGDLPVRLERVGDDLVLDVGPVDIPAIGEPGSASWPSARVVVPVDGWLRGYRTEVVDESGAGVAEEVATVHLLSLGERELFSPIALRLAAIGPGLPSATLPRFLGYRTHAGDTLLVSAKFERTARAWRGVHARVRFPFVARAAFVGALRIQPFSLEALPPGGAHEFDVPPGRSEHWWEARPAVNARLLGFGGAVKRHAVLLRLEDRTAARVIWEHQVDTTASGAPRPVPVHRFLWSVGVGLDAGHTYRLTAIYDNPTGAVIPGGGIGTIGGIVLIGGGLHWPAVDTADPVFRADLARMTR